MHLYNTHDILCTHMLTPHTRTWHTHKPLGLSRAWWLTPVVLALGRLGQENPMSAVSLGYIVTAGQTTSTPQPPTLSPLVK